jgi:SAM-dependent methyltransferase
MINRPASGGAAGWRAPARRSDDGPVPGSAVPPRVRWAVDVLDPQPGDRVLEVGGGPGVAAELICARLTTGRLLEVDRSALAVQRTLRRNAAAVAAGRLVVEQAELAGLAVAPGSVDRVLTVDVNLFWVGDPAPELAVLHRALRPGGVLLVAYGTGGPTAADRVAPRVAAALGAAGFEGVELLTGDAGFAIRATVPRRIGETAVG